MKKMVKSAKKAGKNSGAKKVIRIKQVAALTPDQVTVPTPQPTDIPNTNPQQIKDIVKSNLITFAIKSAIKFVVVILILMVGSKVIVPKIMHASAINMAKNNRLISSFAGHAISETGKITNVNGRIITVDINGVKTKVRLASVSAPKKNSLQKYVGKTVYLEKGTLDKCKDGSLYRVVWLTSKPDANKLSTESLNGILLKNKNAKPEIYSGDTLYAEQLVSIYKD